MKIGCIMDPLSKVGVHEDTTFGWMLAAQARGHELYYITPDDLMAEGGQAFAWGQPATVRMPTGDDPSHYSLGAREHFPLAHLDVVWMRRDPPFDTDYLYSTFILELAENNGACWVINNPRALRDANEKAYILHFPKAIPPTLITHRADRIKAFMAKQGGRCIVKPLDGHGGSEIFMLRGDDLNTNSILESLSRNERRYVMAQSYIPEAREGDKRVILIDGEPIGGILRVPKSDDLRGNIHVGGTVIKAELTDRDLEICAMVGPKLREAGLYFVGLDIIGPYMTEINVTSPTGIREMSTLNGVDYADGWIAWIEERRSAQMSGYDG